MANIQAVTICKPLTLRSKHKSHIFEYITDNLLLFQKHECGLHLSYLKFVSLIENSEKIKL